MTMDSILQILQWAIPSGGIGAAIAWVANRRLRAVEEKKKVEDTYKQMYDMVSEELISLQRQNKENYEKIEEFRNENDKTRRALNRLSRAIEAIQLCPHRAACPVSGELSLDEEADRGKHGADKRIHGKGQHRADDKNGAEGEHPCGHGAADGQSGQTAAAAEQRSIPQQERAGGCRT